MQKHSLHLVQRRITEAKDLMASQWSFIWGWGWGGIVDVCTFLTHSINYRFFNEALSVTQRRALSHAFQKQKNQNSTSRTGVLYHRSVLV